MQKRLHLPAVAATIAVAAAGLWMTGCSDGDEEEESLACQSASECPDGQLCEDEICVSPEGDVSCDVHADCPAGMLCEDSDTCVEDSGETACTEHEECSDGRICYMETCVIDPFGPFFEQSTEEGDYHISFMATSSSHDDEVRLIPAGASESSVVDTGSIDCDAAHRCGVSADGTHLLVVEQGAGANSFDIYSAELAEDSLSVVGEKTLLASDAISTRFRGDGVIFRRDDGGSFVGYYVDHQGQERQLLGLHSVGASLPEAWDYHPATDRLLHFVPIGLESLDIHVGGQDRHIGEELVFLDGANRRGDGGSLFIGSVPSGVSQDGRFVAFSTTGPNNYENCQSDDQCSGTGRVCGSDLDRCVAVEATVHIVDMAYADNIRSPCTSHEACGPVHRCDSGAADFDGGTCQPQRIVVGVPNSPGQGSPVVSGCEATREDGSMSYTNIDAPLTFGADNRVYFVGRRDCVRSAADASTNVESNIPKTSILAGDLQTGEIEEIWGNPDSGDFAIADCGQGQETANEDCRLFLDSSRVSPGGTDLIFTGTNSVSGSQGLATSRLDIWRVSLQGEGAIAIGRIQASHTVRDVMVQGEEDEGDDEEMGGGDNAGEQGEESSDDE